jgi:hypothetical protein
VAILQNLHYPGWLHQCASHPHLCFKESSTWRECLRLQRGSLW